MLANSHVMESVFSSLRSWELNLDLLILTEKAIEAWRLYSMAESLDKLEDAWMLSEFHFDDDHRGSRHLFFRHFILHRDP